MDPGRQIGMLEKALSDLIKDWERFFAGIRKTPPNDERERLERRLRHLADNPPRRSADAFRVQQLQHRFRTYAMNWERMLREREEGRGRSIGMVRAQARAARATPQTPPRPNVSAAAAVDESGSDALFERFVAAKQEAGEVAGVKREAFEAQIKEQRNKLEARFGCKVRFDVVVDGGKVKLAARKGTAKEE
jgi:hypothetical protein